MITLQLTFSSLQPQYKKTVLEWLEKSHVAQWFHGQGLANTLQGIDAFLEGSEKRFDAWVAFENGIPFGFLITFDIEDSEADDPDSPLSKWIEKGKKCITLDLLIGEEKFLGRGLAVRMIQQFIEQVFPDVEMVFIDPEATNSRAIHVYEKAGFQKIDNFIASWHPVPHVLMCKRLG